MICSTVTEKLDRELFKTSTLSYLLSNLNVTSRFSFADLIRQSALVPRPKFITPYEIVVGAKVRSIVCCHIYLHVVSKMSNSKMLVTAPSCTRKAVVFGLGKADNRGGTSTVYCLELVQDHANKGKVHVQGRPFRLYDNNWWYIWDNDFIRYQDIQEGSIVSFQGSRFVGNTGETMVSAVKKYQ